MDTYDYIVVGAGTAGCVVAARLSENPDLQVLLVEAGGSDRIPTLTMPAALPFVYQSKRVQWGYRSGPEPELSGREIDEKSGRVLGGTSSINAMIFNRGNPLDYDGWAADGLDGVGLRPLPALLQADGDLRRRRRRLARRLRPDAGESIAGEAQAVRRAADQR